MRGVGLCVCVSVRERMGEREREGDVMMAQGKWFKLFFLCRFVMISTQTQPSFVRAQLSIAAGCLLAHPVLVT